MKPHPLGGADRKEITEETFYEAALYTFLEWDTLNIFSESSEGKFVPVCIILVKCIEHDR